MENFDHILLFKTDIKSEECLAKLYAILDEHEGIDKWNVDIEDQDGVLRIESFTLKHHQIIELINNHGHLCSELI